MTLNYEDLQVELSVKVKDRTWDDPAEYEKREFNVSYQYEADKDEAIMYIATLIDGRSINNIPDEEWEILCKHIELNEEKYFTRFNDKLLDYFKDEAVADAEEKGEDYFF